MSLVILSSKDSEISPATVLTTSVFARVKLDPAWELNAKSMLERSLHFARSRIRLGSTDRSILKEVVFSFLVLNLSIWIPALFASRLEYWVGKSSPIFVIVSELKPRLERAIVE